ncbi:uncharacterized protein LOC117282559 [Cryptotermes secundus]|uniref:uncharacterized protein LOC117282559 n=1 Tax=Cryptotermes secundus TaxID=105785 RepID=UPI001454CDE2|nr:uncharacterized protein LOC117282559 [Cryptotermes secundus]
MTPLPGIVQCDPATASFLHSMKVHAEVAEDFPSALVPLVSALADSARTDEHCTATGPVCYSCNRAPICFYLSEGKYLSLGSYNCAAQNPAQPYCNSGVCNSTKGKECPQEFQCTGEGYFPDPDDCSTFHSCDASLKATTYTCPASYVYLHANHTCVRKKVSADCATIKCSYARPIEYVVYPKDPSIYGICVRDQPTAVVKCSGGQKFDTKTSKCKRACKEEGVFAADGCRKFYECVRVGSNKYNVVERECPVDKLFNATLKVCAVGSC